MYINYKTLVFLGKIQGRIEDLVELAANSNNEIFAQLTEVEQYFNRNLHELLSAVEADFASAYLPTKGITWNTLPR